MPLIPVGKSHTAIVDSKNLEWLSQYRWQYFTTRGLEYALTTVNNKTMYMHRLIMGLEPGDKRKVDHIDRNGLNNQRSNLRIGTHAQNKQNVLSNKTRNGEKVTSQYRGVFWAKREGFWQAKAKLDGTMYKLGYYQNEHQAGRVVAEWRRQNMPFSLEATQPPDLEAQQWLQDAKLKSDLKTGKINRGCSVEGCPNKHSSRGFCSKHYDRWRKQQL